jgi:2-dehydro-3-deoxyglucarate aldolase
VTEPTTSLKQRMASGALTVGSWITVGHASVAEVMAHAGFDWLVIDIEHSVIELSEVQELVRAIEPTGVASIVRLSSNDPVQIKRVMDTGASGVMVPMVASAEEASAAVRAVHYPPRGTRGVGLARAQGYGADFAGYRTRLAEEAIVIVMIEHVDAVERIDEILAVDGVDGYIIGPYDLSGSLGIPGEFDDPRVAALIARVLEAGQRHGVPGGLHVVDPEPERFARHVAEGFRLIGYGMDLRYLDTIVRRDLAGIRRDLGHLTA